MGCSYSKADFSALLPRLQGGAGSSITHGTSLCSLSPTAHLRNAGGVFLWRFHSLETHRKKKNLKAKFLLSLPGGAERPAVLAALSCGVGGTSRGSVLLQTAEQGMLVGNRCPGCQPEPLGFTDHPVMLCFLFSCYATKQAVLFVR